MRTISVAGRCETPERRGYHLVQVSHDARELPVSGTSSLIIRCKLPGRDEDSTMKDLEELKRL